ncbi:hypothetical protein [Nocardioides ferulae]|uniref:hypothetical protein n=1 Tax=Nocardioides ferulae TaxID=2340821 RepID=UPI000EB2CC32|nr:hypothetical protein [Nocardioides ferulae]
MMPKLGYMRAVGQARSCLAALADLAGDPDESSHYERLLIAFDQLVPNGPATWLMDGDREKLLGDLTSAFDELVDHGADPIPLHLLAAVVAVRLDRLTKSSGVRSTVRFAGHPHRRAKS